MRIGLVWIVFFLSLMSFARAAPLDCLENMQSLETSWQIFPAVSMQKRWKLYSNTTSQPFATDAYIEIQAKPESLRRNLLLSRIVHFAREGMTGIPYNVYAVEVTIHGKRYFFDYTKNCQDSIGVGLFKGEELELPKIVFPYRFADTVTTVHLRVWGVLF